MSTFIQWLKGLNKNPDPKQFTWIQGPEDVLRTEVLNYITRQLNVTPLNYHMINAAEESVRDIKTLLSQLPMGLEKSLYVVRNMQEVQDRDFIIDLIKNRSDNPQRYIVFLSTEDKIKTTYDRETKKKYRPAYITAFSGKGHVVECKPFANVYSDSAVEWVKFKLPLITTNTAIYLMEKANGNLRLVRDICIKITAMNTTPSVSLINSLTAQAPRNAFVDALLQQDNPTALTALQSMSEEDYSVAVGQLDSMLELMSLIHDLRIEGRANSEIVKEAKNRAFLVPSLLPYAAHYNHRKVLELRKNLVAADYHLRQGEREGVLESLVAIW